ncbi:hypothetical protein HII36_24585 [Nonomuraea sp. NN258]|uniref:hypothetical protein n=1 Tax=Nonomuraea antri TaxID=2730852 RepID=UPI00156A516C|nr:hypothetical protein [Nonomuraea antri]NRQ34983.1 hypothetical protein [Nonomuraea antri]
MLDVVLALVVVAALPLAIVTIPNTLSVVAKLMPGDIDRAGLMLAHGLALPAVMLTVPFAALLLRRVRAVHLLVGGLALLTVADAAGGYAASGTVVGVVRVLHGVGAGLVLPATLVAVWHRGAVLRGLWLGWLAASLLTAQALALWPLDQVSDWKVALQPYPLVTGIALALAAAYLLLGMLQGDGHGGGAGQGARDGVGAAGLPGVPVAGPGLSLGPAAGVAVIAIFTAVVDLGHLPVIVLAVVAVAGVLAAAHVGVPGHRAAAYTMAALGVVLVPSAAQITLMEMGGLGGPGLRGLWVPFTVAAALAVGAGVAVCRYASTAGWWLTPLGLLAMVVGLCLIRVLVPAADGMVLIVPFTLLTVGAAVAMAAALNGVGVAVAVFGLGLCLAGVLAGYLLGTGVQMTLLSGAATVQELVDGLVGALHLVALVGGFLLVAVIVLIATVSRRGGGGGAAERVATADPGAPAGAASGSGTPATVITDPGMVTAAVPGEGDQPAAAVPDEGGESAAVIADEDMPTGAIPRITASVPLKGAFAQRGPRDVEPAQERGPDDGSGSGTLPTVPPQAPSPEDTARP